MSSVISSNAINTGIHSSVYWFSLHMISNRPQNALLSSGNLFENDKN